jgi:hypothetical protein
LSKYIISIGIYVLANHYPDLGRVHKAISFYVYYNSQVGISLFLFSYQKDRLVLVSSISFFFMSLKGGHFWSIRLLII